MPSARRWSLRTRMQGPCVQAFLQLLLLASVTLNACWVYREAASSLRFRIIPFYASLLTQLRAQNGSTAGASPVLRDVPSAPAPAPHSLALMPDLNFTERLMIGGQACLTEELQELVAYLHNIVLIININYDEAARKTAHFLRAVYGRFFDHVVLIGPNALPDLGVEARTHRGLRHEWAFAYFHLPTVMARFPEAEGFLWTNDDVVLNYWSLLRANKSKLWLPETPDCLTCHHWVPFHARLPEEFNDGWSSSAQNRHRANRALATSNLPHILQYRRSIAPRREGYMKQVVDVFYVPRRHAEALAADILPIYREQRVASEIALPMMFRELEAPQDHDPIFKGMVYKWERGPRYNPAHFWTPQLGAYHHWKLASDSLKALFIETLKARDPCLQHLRPTAPT